MGNLFLWLSLVAFFACVQFLNTPIKTANEGKFLAPPPEHIEKFEFGFRESIADSLWLRWIQDSDSCQTYLSPMKIIENPEAGYEESDKLVRNIRYKNCDHSWGFKMLDAVSKLAPRFKMVYWAGPITLSVVVEDYEGASVIFNRGLEVYPNDWILLYRAAYHFLYDRQDLTRAAELMQRAGENGAPIWVQSLAARLYTKAGQIELGIQSLENYLKGIEKPEARESVEKRLAELRKQLAEQKNK
jgi:tetratricopeptide (TPR) repeat protein